LLEADRSPTTIVERMNYICPAPVQTTAKEAPPVIDTLSKGKQRLVSGLVYELLGDIDNLQKQLDILGGAWGMRLV